MVTLHVNFVGLMCHYDMTDERRPDRTAADPVRRTIIPKFAHHRAFLAVPQGLIVSDLGWPVPIPATLEGREVALYALDGVRLRVMTSPDDSEAVPPPGVDIDSTFVDFVPPLGKVIQNFDPINQNYVKFNSAAPELIAGHFDMRGGRLRVVEFDSFASSFDPVPAGFAAGGKKIPLAQRVRLDIDIDVSETDQIVLVGDFYKSPRRSLRRLILSSDARDILLANVVPSDLGLPDLPVATQPGNGHDHNGHGDREGHFELYSLLSDNAAVGSTKLIVPDLEDRGRGMSGGCPGTNYPP